MSTTYILAYGRSPRDRFSVKAYRSKRAANVAADSLAVRLTRKTFGPTYVIEREEDVTFPGSLLLDVYNAVAKATGASPTKRFANRKQGAARLLSALKPVPVEMTSPGAKEKGRMAKDDNGTRGLRTLKDLPDDGVIHILVDECPRRPGTNAAENWAKYEEGMTVAEYRAAGGDPARLRTDIKRGNLEVKGSSLSAVAA